MVVQVVEDEEVLRYLGSGRFGSFLRKFCIADKLAKQRGGGGNVFEYRGRTIKGSEVGRVLPSLPRWQERSEAFLEETSVVLRKPVTRSLTC
jgi:hypothetical protein